ALTADHPLSAGAGCGAPGARSLAPSLSHAAICSLTGAYQITSGIPSALTSPAVEAIQPGPGPGISGPGARTFVPSISHTEKRFVPALAQSTSAIPSSLKSAAVTPDHPSPLGPGITGPGASSSAPFISHTAISFAAG